jgi:hypothetical protein
MWHFFLAGNSSNRAVSEAECAACTHLRIDFVFEQSFTLTGRTSFTVNVGNIFVVEIIER